jgi:hypothetical protein
MLGWRRPLKVVKQNEITIVKPGNTVTFQVPFKDDLPSGNARLEIRGQFTIACLWDGHRLIFTDEPGGTVPNV